MKEYTDETPMPFGKHKGVPLIDVPASYLMWLYDNDLEPGALRRYIEDNLDVLQKQINE